MEKDGMLKRQLQGRQWCIVLADGSLDSRADPGAGADDEPFRQTSEEEFPF